MEQRRILIIANNDGGLYHFRLLLIENLLAQGNEVYISDPSGDFIQYLIDMGCEFIDAPIDRRGINPITDLRLLKKYFDIANQVEPDLVITYTIKPNIYGGIVCRLKKIPYAANITGLGTALQKQGLLKVVVTALYKMAIRKAKVVFFENAENEKTLIDMNICRKGQSKLLNGAGVDLEHYTYLEYPTEDIPIHFLFIGRVMKEKGIDELVSAMERLCRDGEKCVLDVVGEYEEDYSADFECYQKDGWLRYYGHQKDVRPFIQNAHCFVLPSWHEGMANTNLECAASGRPIITSNIAGCREAVIENETGFLCQPKDAESLYEAMKRFLALSTEQRVAMGQAGRRHMENTFDKRKVVEETLKCLE